MELKIKNKWISFKGSSTVEDLNDNPVLYVEGKFFTFTRKKFVKDLQNNLLFTVRNKFWHLFIRKAFVYDAGEKCVATIKRKFFSFRDRYFIESDYGNFEINGNILQFNYAILKDGQEVGHIARRVSLRDSFVLTINDDANYAFYVALVIAIDNITDAKNASASSISFNV